MDRPTVFDVTENTTAAEDLAFAIGVLDRVIDKRHEELGLVKSTLGDARQKLAGLLTWRRDIADDTDVLRTGWAFRGE